MNTPKWISWGLVALSVVMAVGVIIVFPYQETETERIQLLPGNHTWAQSLPTHEIFSTIVMYEQDFLRLADGYETHVSADGSYITYEVVRGGIPLQYRQFHSGIYPSLFGYDQSGRGDDAEIQDGVLVSVLHRDGFGAWFLVFLLVVFPVIGLWRWISQFQSRRTARQLC